MEAKDLTPGSIFAEPNTGVMSMAEKVEFDGPLVRVTFSEKLRPPGTSGVEMLHYTEVSVQRVGYPPPIPEWYDVIEI